MRPVLVCLVLLEWQVKPTCALSLHRKTLPRKNGMHEGLLQQNVKDFKAILTDGLRKVMMEGR